MANDWCGNVGRQGPRQPAASGHRHRGEAAVLLFLFVDGLRVRQQDERRPHHEGKVSLARPPRAPQRREQGHEEVRRRVEGRQPQPQGQGQPTQRRQRLGKVAERPEWRRDTTPREGGVGVMSCHGGEGKGREEKREEGSGGEGRGGRRRNAESKARPAGLRAVLCCVALRLGS